MPTHVNLDLMLIKRNITLTEPAGRDGAIAVGVNGDRTCATGTGIYFIFIFPRSPPGI